MGVPDSPTTVAPCDSDAAALFKTPARTSSRAGDGLKEGYAAWFEQRTSTALPELEVVPPAVDRVSY